MASEKKNSMCTQNAQWTTKTCIDTQLANTSSMMLSRNLQQRFVLNRLSLAYGIRISLTSNRNYLWLEDSWALFPQPDSRHAPFLDCFNSLACHVCRLVRGFNIHCYDLSNPPRCWTSASSIPNMSNLSNLSQCIIGESTSAGRNTQIELQFEQNVQASFDSSMQSAF